MRKQKFCRKNSAVKFCRKTFLPQEGFCPPSLQDRIGKNEIRELIAYINWKKLGWV